MASLTCLTVHGGCLLEPLGSPPYGLSFSSGLDLFVVISGKKRATAEVAGPLLASPWKSHKVTSAMCRTWSMHVMRPAQIQEVGKEPLPPGEKQQVRLRRGLDTGVAHQGLLF